MRQKKMILISCLIGAVIVAVLLIAVQVSARGSGSPSAQAVVVQGQPERAPLRLEAAFVGNALIGTVTVSDKDGRPWTDTRGQARLLDSSGQPQAAIPLQPLAPGEFRVIVPLSRLSGPGYLDVQLPGHGGRHGVYEINSASHTVTWTKAAPGEPGILSLQATGGPDAFGYTYDDSVAYNWVSLSWPTAVPLRNDDYAGPLNIGFTFKFYGKSYTQFYIDSNGYLSLSDNGRSYWNYSKFRLPSPARPNNTIAPFWEDFEPESGGTIRYETKGSAPNRYLVVEWTNVPLLGDGSNGQYVQAVLYETSNKIQFNYPNNRYGTWGDLRDSTVGVENEDGTIGLLYPSTIPIDVAQTVEFNPNQASYNVLLTPDRQGNSGTGGSSVAFNIQVRNMGASADTYALTRTAYLGSNWPVSFYASDGTTPLPGNSTGSISSASQITIVAKVTVTGTGAITIGDWTRATVQATSQGNPSKVSTATLDVAYSPSFYQAYTDNESGDGTEDSENYAASIMEGANYTQRLTTDRDNSNYSGVASTPDGNTAFTVWNTDYWNSNGVRVSEINYAAVNRYGSLARTISRLTNNSGATQTTYDFSPSAAVAANGNLAVGWARQRDTNGDGSLDRYDVWYTILNSGGDTVKALTALTSNTSNYPRDYPPSVVALAGGNFLLTWEHATSSSAIDVYYAILSSTGSVVKAVTNLTSAGGTGLNGTPRAAALPDGSAAIVWTSYNIVGITWYGNIYYAVLDASGTVLNSPTAITTNGSNISSQYADAAALSDKTLAVAWTQFYTSSSQIQYTLISPANLRRPAMLQSTIYTVPTALNTANIYPSLTVDDNDRVIMTWLDNAQAYYLFYALVGNTGADLTPATVLQRTRRYYLWSSWNGYGNAYMSPPFIGTEFVYLPVTIKNYPPVPPQPVANGGFESGLTSWTPAGSGLLAPTTTTSPVHSGSRAGVIGRLDAPCQADPHGDSSLSQSVQVPITGTPQLSLWYRIKSYDRLVGDKYDWFGVYINGTLVLQTGRISSTPVTGCGQGLGDTGWQQFTYDLSGYKGQTIVLRVVNHTSDQWYNTWTYVDDVSIMQ